MVKGGFLTGAPSALGLAYDSVQYLPYSTVHPEKRE
jgi:hypothetical protein